MTTNVQDFLLAMKERVEKSVEKEIKKTIERKICDNLEVMVNSGIISIEDAKSFAKSQAIDFRVTKLRSNNKTSCGGCSCTSN